MIKYINLILKFFICIILAEISIFKKRISYCKFFLYNINFLKYFIYIFDKSANPLKTNEFSNFIKTNKNKWENSKKNEETNSAKENIIIENFVNHPSYTINNILIGKYLQHFKNYNLIGLLRKEDIKGEVIFRSFGIKKFYYYKFGGFFLRSKYIFKSLITLKNIEEIKDLYNLKVRKIDIGLEAYNTYMRYTGNPNAKKINLKIICYFAEGLYANDFFEKIFEDSKITKMVQSEKQFIPMGILFQKALFKKKKVFARFLSSESTVRIYTNFDQRYKSASTISKKLFEQIYNNFRNKSIKLINKYYKTLAKSKAYGQSWSHIVPQNKKMIDEFWKWSSQNEKKQIEKKNNAINFKTISKENLCQMFCWNKKKKDRNYIFTIFN